MDEKKRTENKQRSSGSRTFSGIVIYLIALFLISLSRSGVGNRAVFGVLVTFIIAGAAVAIAFKRSMAAIAKKKEGEKKPSFSALSQMPRMQRSNGQVSPAQPKPARPQAAPAPTYHDKIREEDAARDRQRRLKQLEDFYKNGIVDKEEYRLLRKRYEQEGR